MALCTACLGDGTDGEDECAACEGSGILTDEAFGRFLQVAEREVEREIAERGNIYAPELSNIAYRVGEDFIDSLSAHLKARYAKYIRAERLS